MSNETIWIIGAGRFGRIAFERLSGAKSRRRFALVDLAVEEKKLPRQASCETIAEDGIAFLHERLLPGDEPDWIVPAVPVHLAAQWCLKKLGPEKVRRIALPEAMGEYLPNPIFGKSGDVYVSYADFLCPDNCPEPEDHCFVTGKPREAFMFDRLSRLSFPGFSSLNIRSHQLAPGVGGYRPESLFALLEKVRHAENDLVVSTACRCHGVLTGMRKAAAVLG